MEAKNIDLIHEELKSLGFQPDADLDRQIHEKSALDHRKFSVNFQQEFEQFNSKCMVDFEMYFKWHERPDMYFPFAYKATLRDDIEKSQVLPLGSNIRIHAKEAFNLLNDRAVNKQLMDKDTGKFYNTWFQFDFNYKDAHGNYLCNEYRKEVKQFVLAEHLAIFDIKGLEDKENKVRLIASLNRGDAVPVNVLKNEKEFSVFVQASPATQTIDFLTSDKKRLPQSEVIRLNRKNPTPEEIPKHRKRKGRGL